MNVALMSGLPKAIVEKAKLKSTEINDKIKKISLSCTMNKNGNSNIYDMQTWS